MLRSEANPRLELGMIRWQQPAFQRRLVAAAAAVARAFRTVRSPRPYVAFSGGKDSIATAALVRAVRPETPLVWSDDELEYPETIDYMEWAAEALQPFLAVRGTGPHAGWFEPWSERPHFRDPAFFAPESVREWEGAERINLRFLGTRMEENSRRFNWLAQTGPQYRIAGGFCCCCPILDWSADDVWALIAGWRLEYNAAYDRFAAIGLADRMWRVGPLPLAPRETLAAGWPDLLERLESRYGRRWK